MSCGTHGQAAPSRNHGGDVAPQHGRAEGDRVDVCIVGESRGHLDQCDVIRERLWIVLRVVDDQAARVAHSAGGEEVRTRHHSHSCGQSVSGA